MFFLEPLKLAFVKRFSCVLRSLAVRIFWVAEAYLTIDSFPVFSEVASSLVRGAVVDVRFKDPRFENRNSSVDSTDLFV